MSPRSPPHAPSRHGGQSRDSLPFTRQQEWSCRIDSGVHWFFTKTSQCRKHLDSAVTMVHVHNLNSQHHCGLVSGSPSFSSLPLKSPYSITLKTRGVISTIFLFSLSSLMTTFIKSGHLKISFREKRASEFQESQHRAHMK